MTSSPLIQPRHQSSVSLWKRTMDNVKSGLQLLTAREEDKCRPQPNMDLCEKPAISSQSTTWIIVGVVLGVLLVGTGSVLIFLHIRKTKREKREDLEDRFQMSDYGLDDVPGRGPPRKTDGEHRLSMDDLPQPGAPRRPGQPNPFIAVTDDAASIRSAAGIGGRGQSWPKRVDSSSTESTGVTKKPESKEERP